VAHLGVQEILVDGREFLAKSLVQLSDDLIVATHARRLLVASSV
jgi:hypothetical protein